MNIGTGLNISSQQKHTQACPEIFSAMMTKMYSQENDEAQKSKIMPANSYPASTVNMSLVEPLWAGISGVDPP
jgi:hypothetical protein